LNYGEEDNLQAAKGVKCAFQSEEADSVKLFGYSQSADCQEE
jgi:hypothetical protein